MADSKVSALSTNTAPIGGDALYLIDDLAGTPTSQRIFLGDLNALPNGFIVNGKISVTVATNNITVALKTNSGGNPSSTDPVSVWLNGSFRHCTAALSVTKNAGTNWFNSGASELAAKEIDYFAYLIWNTTPATDILDIGFARIPTGRVYSDFSGTTTNEKYLAFGNASTPTSTDDVCVIGRFAATLSASASFNWSVPTYTNTNLIQHPIYETRDLTWAPTHSRTTTPYTNLPTITSATYRIVGSMLKFREDHTQNGVPGGTGNQRYTLPFTVANQVAAPTQNNSVATLLWSAVSTTSGTIWTVGGAAEATASQRYITNGEYSY